MELREFADQILLNAEIDCKLAAPTDSFTDEFPGPPTRLSEPSRSPELQFAPRRAAPKMPSLGALEREEKRGLAHHIMANHELQALEVMAWVLRAFPDAPAEYRFGMANIMRDEQRHTRMHIERAARLGCRFGSHRVNCYIWKKAMAFSSVLDYLAGLPLVLEAANLDHSIELAETFDRFGDERSCALMRIIHRDEIEHVRFGLTWLQRLKPEQLTDFEAFQQHLHWPLRAAKARGNLFQREARREAGMTEDFLNGLEAAAQAEST